MSAVAGYVVLVAVSSWLLTWTAHAVIVQMLALVAGRMLVRAPALRGTLWKCALVLPFVTATIAVRGWRPVAAWRDVSLADLARGTSAFGQNGVWVERRVTRHGAALPVDQSFITSSRAVVIAGAVVALALVGAMFGVGRLAVRRRRFRQHLAGRIRVAGLDGGALPYRLSVSATLPSPVALHGNEICVPARVFHALPGDEQESALAHEAAHLARHDPFWFALGDLITAIAPWQPAIRPLMRALRRDAEFCCDDAVLRSRGDGQALVRSLIRFAGAFDPAESALVPSCGGSPLEARVQRLLWPERPARHRAGVGLALILGLLVAGAAAGPAITTRTTRLPPRAGGPGDTHRIIIQEMPDR